MTIMADRSDAVDDGPQSARRGRRGASRALHALAANGLDLVRLVGATRDVGRFARDRRTFRRQASSSSGPFRRFVTLPMLSDRAEQAGTVSDQYFQQDLHVARCIREADPVRHVDVGSRLDGFVAHLLVFRAVEVIDVRPLESSVDGLAFVQGDATRLVGLDDSSVESLSSLHAIEHMGLGRYGDPIDVDGWSKALAEFQRVLAPGGRLYVSVPIGRRRVEFNAHRVFDPLDLVEALTELELARFDGIDDGGRFHADVVPSTMGNNEYGLGIYTFSKP